MSLEDRLDRLINSEGGPRINTPEPVRQALKNAAKRFCTNPTECGLDAIVAALDDALGYDEPLPGELERCENEAQRDEKADLFAKAHAAKKAEIRAGRDRERHFSTSGAAVEPLLVSGVDGTLNPQREAGPEVVAEPEALELEAD